MKKIVLLVSALSFAALSQTAVACACDGGKKPADSTTQPTTDKTPSTPPKA